MLRRHHLPPGRRGADSAWLPVLSAGQCCGNALAESFPSAIKGQFPGEDDWPGRTTARHAVTGYIAWYNGTCLHSALRYRAPAGYGAAAGQTTLRP